MSDSEPGQPSQPLPEGALVPADSPPSAPLESPPSVELPPPLPKILPAPSAPVPSESTPVGPWLLATVIVVGLLQLVLNVLAPADRASLDGIAFKFGQVLGGTLILPAIVVGLFSIGRGFRTGRSRAIILLVVWGLAGYTAVERMARARQSAALRQFMERVAKPALEEPAESAAPERVADDATGESLSAADEAAMRGYDFSTGSDQRLSALIEHAHEIEYHRVVAGYARACAARPRDAVLALERVRFIQGFADAEDFYIESASDDHDAAVEYLTRHFPSAPGTVLYQLENTADDEIETEARKSVAHVPNWPAADRATFFLLRAQAANRKDADELARRCARESFTADATAEAGLLLARLLHDAEQDAGAREVLLHGVFDEAQPWEKKQKMELLFDLKESDLALALYTELQETLPQALHNTDVAMRLARSGRIDAARALFADLTVNEWNRDDIQRARLRFELEYGGAEHALAAYRDRRATGILADPLLRDRLELFWKFPGLAWNFDDVLGAILLGLILVATFASPLLVLAPVHYWSLLRTRRGRPGAWPEARWGLRHAWFAFGALALAEVIATWRYAPGWFLTFVDEVGVESLDAIEQILPMQSFVWLTGVMVLAIYWWRARAARLLGPGTWGVGKAIGIGFGLACALRLGLRLYVLIWPGVVGLDLAAAVSLEVQLYRELIAHTGSIGMVLIVAGFVPVAEEMLFRGVLLQALAKHIPFGWANALQAAGFAALHQKIALFPFFMAFGVVCGLLARRSGGLLPSIVVHASNNLLACITVLRMQSLLS